MKIYRFSGWITDVNVRMNEIEVEEKPKSYVGNGTRVSKSQIDVLDNYNNMYCLSDDPTQYINAMIERTKRKLSIAKSDVARFEKVLGEWERKKETNEGATK